MFSADLSWTGPDTETVGKRRERKARERGSVDNSIKTSSTRSSQVIERELWWTSGLKKAKDIKSNILRPASHHSTGSQKNGRYGSKKFELKLPIGLRDPIQEPAWACPSTNPPVSQSGAPFDDLPVHDVPELEGDSSSRRTNSTEARFSRKCNRITSTSDNLADSVSTRSSLGSQNTRPS
jgi:hypothetical protein